MYPLINQNLRDLAWEEGGQYQTPINSLVINHSTQYFVSVRPTRRSKEDEGRCMFTVNISTSYLCAEELWSPTEGLVLEQRSMPNL